MKARSKRLSKITVEHSSIVGERLFINISLPVVTSLGGKLHWLLIINDKSESIFSFFLKEKSDLATTMISFVIELKSKHKMIVKCIHCDNKCENKSLKIHTKKEIWSYFSSKLHQITQKKLSS